MAASMLPMLGFQSLLEKRKFTMCLSPGAVGVQLNQKQLVQSAHEHKFESISAFGEELAGYSGTQIMDLLGEMKEKGLVWGAASLSVDFRKSEQLFQEGLNKLPKIAKALKTAGVDRMGTWIMPTHQELAYMDNFHQHARRLQAIANILGHHGIRLGLEYVGPKTLMSLRRYPFLHSMPECLQLIDAIGEDNVGLLLDSFHWFCSGGTVAELLTLDNKDIVACDLNDARSGFTADEQIDGKRELPSATGVIDLKAFLGALVTIGYDGPIRAEPFNQSLRDMEDEAALKATYKAMKKSFDLV